MGCKHGLKSAGAKCNGSRQFYGGCCDWDGCDLRHSFYWQQGLRARPGLSGRCLKRGLLGSNWGVEFMLGIDIM